MVRNLPAMQEVVESAINTEFPSSACFVAGSKVSGSLSPQWWLKGYMWFVPHPFVWGPIFLDSLIHVGLISPLIPCAAPERGMTTLEQSDLFARAAED